MRAEASNFVKLFCALAGTWTQSGVSHIADTGNSED